MLSKLFGKDAVRRVLHTAWQAAGGVLLASLEVPHADWTRKAIFAVVQAAFLSALKAVLVSQNV